MVNPTELKPGDIFIILDTHTDNIPRVVQVEKINKVSISLENGGFIYNASFVWDYCWRLPDDNIAKLLYDK